MKKLLFTLQLIFVYFISMAQNCPNPPTVSIQATSSSVCSGDSIVLTAIGALTYQWNNGISNGQSFIPAVSANYTVIGFDGGGCSDTAEIFIEVKSLPAIEIEVDKTIVCQGDSVLLIAQNGISYQWLNPPGLINNSWFVPTVLGVNVFVVNGTGANGCDKNSQVVVLVKESPANPIVNTEQLSTCLNVPFDLNVTASINNLRIFWYNDLSLDSVRSETDILSIPNNFVYQKTYYARSFFAGCYSSPVPVLVTVNALPEVSAGEDITVQSGDIGNLAPSIGQDVSIVWSPAAQLVDTRNPFTSFQALNSTTYTLTATDINGCVNTDEMTLKVEEKLNIAGMLSPNGDGSNDTWKVYPIESLKECQVRIFDGFGREIINTTTYENNWDGTYEGKQLPDGDYYYHIKCKGFEEKGTLILVR